MVENPFSERLKQRYSENPEPTQENPYDNPFSERANSKEYKTEHKEKGLKQGVRTAMQVVQGFAATTLPGLAASLWQILATGAAFDPEEIDHIKAISEREGVPFDEEKWYETAHEALKYIPTVSNIAREVEEQTGLPMEPKTRFQKGLRFLTEASRLSRKGGTFRGMNTKLNRPVLGAGVETVKEILQEAGLPEPLSEIASFAILKHPTEGAGEIRFGAKKKPSGLTERRYENLNKKTNVSPKTFNKINEKVEKEFRNISDKIIKASPIAETHAKLRDSSEFKTELRESFKEVKKLAENIPGTFSTTEVKHAIIDRVSKEKGTGFTPQESDRTYKKYIKDFINETPNKNITAQDLELQFRKNNEALGEAYEPGQSFGYNRGKRKALRDYNLAIADIIEQKYPNSEFAQLFEETNAQWTKIKDAEAIDEFIDGIFDGSINHKQATQLLDKPGKNVPFKKALGAEGYRHFTQLVQDLLGTQKPYKMLKVGQKKGFFSNNPSDLLAFVMHPKLAATKMAVRAAHTTFKSMMEALLDKPKLAFTWKTGIQDLKKGNFVGAEKHFEALKQAEEAFKATQREAKLSETEIISAKEKPTAPNKNNEIIEAKVTRQEKPPTKGEYEEKKLLEHKSKKEIEGAAKTEGKPEFVKETADYEEKKLLEHKPKQEIVEPKAEEISAKEYPKETEQPKQVEVKTKAPEPAPLPEAAKPNPKSKPKVALKSKPKLKTEPEKLAEPTKSPQITLEPSVQTAAPKKPTIAQIVFNDILEGQKVSEPEKKLMLHTRVALMQTRGKQQQFHGTKTPISELSPDIYTTSSEKNIYGAGFYTTDALDIADGYSKPKMSSTAIVYTVKEKTPQKLYDAEQPIKQFRALVLEQLQKEREEQVSFFDFPKEMINLNELKERDASFDDPDYKLLRAVLKKHNFYSDIFDTHTKSVRDLFDKIRDDCTRLQIPLGRMQAEFSRIMHVLSDNGYQGMTHKGGLLTKNAPHLVKIYWHPENLEIQEFSYPKNLKKIAKAPTPTPGKRAAIQLEATQGKISILKKRPRQDISKAGLKTQKQWILDRIDDVLAHPDKYRTEKIVFDVPGDGEFKIHNSEKALTQFRKDVQKKWPDKPLTEAQMKTAIKREIKLGA